MLNQLNNIKLQILNSLKLNVISIQEYMPKVKKNCIEYHKINHSSLNCEIVKFMLQISAHE